MEFELLDGSAADKRWSMNPLRNCCWMHHLYWLREEERDLPSLLDSPAAHCGGAHSQR
jgi:hypothetical protein